MRNTVLFYAFAAIAIAAGLANAATPDAVLDEKGGTYGSAVITGDPVDNEDQLYTTSTTVSIKAEDAWVVGEGDDGVTIERQPDVGMTIHSATVYGRWGTCDFKVRGKFLGSESGGPGGSIEWIAEYIGNNGVALSLRINTPSTSDDVIYVKDSSSTLTVDLIGLPCGRTFKVTLYYEGEGEFVFGSKIVPLGAIDGEWVNSATLKLMGETPGEVTIGAEAADAAVTPCEIPAAVLAQSIQSVFLAPDTIAADGASKSMATAIVVPEGYPVIWSISSTNKLGCHIDDPQTGEVTAGTQTGDVVIRASDPFDLSVVAEATLHLVGSSATATVTPSAIVADDTSTAVATGVGGPFTWTIDEPNYGCSIDANGVVTAGTQGGIITIRGTGAGGTITGCLALVKVTDAAVNPTVISTKRGASSYASAKITAGRQLKFSPVGDDLGCVIDEVSGTVTPGSSGGTITIRAEDSELPAAYAETTLQIAKINSVTLDHAAIAANGADTCTATADSAGGRSVTWSIIADVPCTIDSSGVVHAGDTGGMVTVRARDSQLTEVYAQARLPLVKIDDVSLDCYELPADGESTTKAVAWLTPSDRTVTWSIPDDGGTGTYIDADGVITAGDKTGTVTIRAVDSEASAAMYEVQLDLVSP